MGSFGRAGSCNWNGLDTIAAGLQRDWVAVF
jgi:hypothetical protein